MSDAGYLAFLDALRNPAKGNFLNSLFLRLWVNAFTPGHATPLGAFTEASFGGYGPQSTTNWGPPAVNSSSVNVDTLDMVHTFTATGPPLPQTVVGAYLTDAAGAGGSATQWYLAWVSEDYSAGTPVVLNAAGQFYNFQPRLTLAVYPAYP
jgi:hypothetical protein